MSDEFVNNQDFWNMVAEEATAADAFSERANYGKLTVKKVRFVHWQESVPTDVTFAQYQKLPRGDRSMELTFAVDIQELNPQLEFTYERIVVLKGGNTDWNKIVRPSLVNLLGEKALSAANYASTLQSLNGKYVEVHDVPQVKKPEYNTIEFHKIFGSKEECEAAYQARYSGAGSTSTASATVPLDWTEEVWTSTVHDEREAGKTDEQIAESYGVDVSFVEAVV
jgi:hypothetical protein